MVTNTLTANVESTAAFLALMGNEKRLLMMIYLAEGELSVGALAEKVQLSQSALSQHLAKLRNSDLVETRRDRQTIYYSCKSAAARKLLTILNGLLVNCRERQSEQDGIEGQRRPEAA